jgi:hypothetical protein
VSGPSIASLPTRLPDAAPVEARLGGLSQATADADLAPALAAAFPGVAFTVAAIDDDYWRDERTVLGPDAVRLGEHRAWLNAELAAHAGDLNALLRTSTFQLTEWRGHSVFLSAQTGPGAADYVQIALGRESECLAGPIVDPHFRPYDLDALLQPSWIARDDKAAAHHLIGPVYRLSNRPGAAVAHVRSFLARCGRVERDRREARRPEMEQRDIREVGPEGTRETPFLQAVPDWFDHVPREVRFFDDWAPSSAAAQHVHDHWALDIRDSEHGGGRHVSFIPRPLHQPAEQLTVAEGTSIHILMDRIEALDREIGLPFGWLFPMTHGTWVDPDIGHAIAAGRRAQRVRLPDRDAQVLLRWANTPYGF